MTQPAPIKEQFLEGQTGLVGRVWLRWFDILFALLNNLVQSTVTISVTSSPYTVTTNTFRIVCDTDGGDMVVNYPEGFPDASARVVNAGTSGNDVTMNGNGSELIAGLSSQTLYDQEVYEAIYTVAGGWR